MNAYGNYSKIMVIDNTVSNLLEDSYQKGYTELYRQTIPNQARIIDSKVYPRNTIIYFYEYGLITTPFGTFLKNSSIILADNKLVLPGCLAARIKISPTVSGIITHNDMEYLQVLYSNLNGVQRGDLVIIGANQRQKINFEINNEYKKMVFVQKQAIYLVVNRYGVESGPEYEMVGVEDRQGIKGERRSSKGSNSTFFIERVLSFKLFNKDYDLVNKKSIVAKMVYK